MSRLFSLISIFFLIGCTTTDTAQEAAEGDGVQDPLPVIEDSSQVRCADMEFQRLIGQLITEVHTDSLPRPVRIYSTSDMVTQDYRPERLNIVHTDEGRISRVFCG